MTIADVDGFFYAEKIARLQFVSYICGELSSIFRFLMMYNLLFVPGLKKSGTFLLFHVKKVAKNFCFT